VNDINSYKMTI